MLRLEYIVNLNSSFFKNIWLKLLNQSPTHTADIRKVRIIVRLLIVWFTYWESRLSLFVPVPPSIWVSRDLSQIPKRDSQNIIGDAIIWTHLHWRFTSHSCLDVLADSLSYENFAVLFIDLSFNHLGSLDFLIYWFFSLFSLYNSVVSFITFFLMFWFLFAGLVYNQTDIPFLCARS